MRALTPPRNLRLAPLVLAMMLTTASVSSCGSSGDGTQLSVFAAASLTDVMEELEAEFEASNQGLDVSVNFAGSTTLRTQIIEGAPADVVVLANQPVMDELLAEQAVGEVSLVAANRMVLAVPLDNPGDVQSLIDLEDDALLVGLCDSDVPCGASARIILKSAGVSVAADTNEPDVRSLVAKIASGELDAGIVYATDLASSGNQIAAIEIDPSLYEPNVYPIAITTDASNEAEAQLFIDFLLSPAGQSVLASHGFLPPNGAS